MESRENARDHQATGKQVMFTMQREEKKYSRKTHEYIGVHFYSRGLQMFSMAGGKITRNWKVRTERKGLQIPVQIVLMPVLSIQRLFVYDDCCKWLKIDAREIECMYVLINRLLRVLEWKLLYWSNEESIWELCLLWDLNNWALKSKEKY